MRDELYGLAEIAVVAYRDRVRRSPPRDHLVKGDATASFIRAIADVPEDEQVQIEERAAIHEFDANVDRDLAERLSVTDWLKTRG